MIQGNDIVKEDYHGFDSLQEEMMYLLNIDEVYFGKSESIAAIEKQLDLFRKKYMGTKMLPLADVELMKLNKMIEDQFGFGNFALYIILDPIPMACTTPIEYSFGIEKKENNYIVDATTYKFKKEYNYTCMITMSTGLIFNPLFTTEEIMACLLYELGTNFYSCFSHTNAILSNVYTATSIASTIADFVQGFWLANKAAVASAEQIATDMATAKNLPELLENPEVKAKLAELQATSPEKAQQFLDLAKKEIIDRQKPIYMKDMGPTIKKIQWTIFGLGSVSALANTPGYYKLQSKIQNKFRRNSCVQSTMIGFTNYLKLAGRYIVQYLSQIYSVFNFVNVKVNGFLKWAGIKELLLPLQSFINKAMNPMSWLALPVNYRVERAANNFPTMYGYSAAMVSYFEKMKGVTNVKCVSHFLQNHPMINILYDTITVPSRILTSVFDPNPSNLARCHDQIKMLEAELSKSGLPSKMKATIMRDITECKKAIKTLTDISHGVEDPDLCKKIYNKALEDFMSGVGLKERLLDDKGRFAAYDQNVQTKSEGTVLQEGILDWFSSKPKELEKLKYNWSGVDSNDYAKTKALRNYILYGIINTKLKPGIQQILKQANLGRCLYFDIEDDNLDDFIEGPQSGSYSGSGIWIVHFDIWEHPLVKQKKVDARDLVGDDINGTMTKVNQTIDKIAAFIKSTGYGHLDTSWEGDWDTCEWDFYPNLDKLNAFIQKWDNTKHRTHESVDLSIAEYLAPGNEGAIQEADIEPLSWPIRDLEENNLINDDSLKEMNEEMTIRRNFEESSESVFTGVVPKETFGFDDFDQSILPNADTGRFDSSMDDKPYKHNDPNAADAPGVEVSTPGIEVGRKFESADMDAGLTSICGMLSGPEPSMMNEGMAAIQEALGGF